VEEIEGALAAFETAEGFVGPCEMLTPWAQIAQTRYFAREGEPGLLLTLRHLGTSDGYAFESIIAS
jgi:hypothetical protein